MEDTNPFFPRLILSFESKEESDDNKEENRSSDTKQAKPFFWDHGSDNSHVTYTSQSGTSYEDCERIPSIYFLPGTTDVNPELESRYSFESIDSPFYRAGSKFSFQNSDKFDQTCPKKEKSNSSFDEIVSPYEVPGALTEQKPLYYQLCPQFSDSSSFEGIKSPSRISPSTHKDDFDKLCKKVSENISSFERITSLNEKSPGEFALKKSGYQELFPKTFGNSSSFEHLNFTDRYVNENSDKNSDRNNTNTISSKKVLSFSDKYVKQNSDRNNKSTFSSSEISSTPDSHQKNNKNSLSDKIHSEENSSLKSASFLDGYIDHNSDKNESKTLTWNESHSTLTKAPKQFDYLEKSMDEITDDIESMMFVLNETKCYMESNRDETKKSEGKSKGGFEIEHTNNYEVDSDDVFL